MPRTEYTSRRTLRDEFANTVLASKASEHPLRNHRGELVNHWDSVASSCYAAADAMMHARKGGRLAVRSPSPRVARKAKRGAK